jgi:hypothetical protein
MKKKIKSRKIRACWWHGRRYKAYKRC